MPGLVPQLRGRPTNKRFCYATIFVEVFNRLNYIYLHERNDIDNILAAKSDFERFALTSNVKVLRYHCDNGIFGDNALRAACEASPQRITFCGTNAHRQNSIAE